MRNVSLRVVQGGAARRYPDGIDVERTQRGGLEGRYVVEEQRPDGAVLIRPDLSVASILARHGERQLTSDELPDWVHELPADEAG